MTAGLDREAAPALAALLAAMPDPAAVDEHWRRICTEQTARARRDGYHAGYRAGYVRAVEEIKAVEHQLVDALGGIDLPQVMARRWHVCCAACQRRGRHQSGCDRCEDRTRATFGQPHPDDYPGRQHG